MVIEFLIPLAFYKKIYFYIDFNELARISGFCFSVF